MIDLDAVNPSFMMWFYHTGDKFTKWIEAMPTASITTTKAIEFICEVMYWFGGPNNIITDNGTQITVKEFQDLCRCRN
jgi:hypothetical protein